MIFSSRLRAFARRFDRDERGNILIIVALMSTVLVYSVGVAVDYMRAVHMRTALQGAVDSAALAGASAFTDAGLQTTAQNIATNYFSNAVLPTHTGTITPTAVGSVITTAGVTSAYQMTVTATATMPTTFMAFLQSSMPITATATAKDFIVTSTVNFGSWTSSAYDQNCIYYFEVPSDGVTPEFDLSGLNSTSTCPSTVGYANTDANNKLSDQSFHFLFTNKNSGTPANASFNMAAGQNIGFAFVNQVNGTVRSSSYTQNGYGAAAYTWHVFYSTESPPNNNKYNQAYDASLYNQGHGESTSGMNGGFCNATLEVQKVNSDGTVPAVNTNCTDWTTSPYNAFLQHASPSCSELNGSSYNFAWNDMGGGGDDFDYNDGVYNYSCSSTTTAPDTVVLTN